jgi:putative DNA primase/helicase
MTDEFEKVRKVLREAEDVDMDGVPVAGAQDDQSQDQSDGDFDPNQWEHSPHPMPDDSDELPPPLVRAAQQPLNDYGNGQRLIIHFGEDIMFVPRVGWFTWSGQHWAKDTDMLRIRSKAQGIWHLIEQEAAHIQPTPRERDLLDQSYQVRMSLRDLDKLDALTDEQQTERQRLDARLTSLSKQLTAYHKKIGTRMTFAKDAGNSGRMDRMISESQTDKAVAFEMLDANPYEVNTAGGLLRFSTIETEGGGKSASVEVIPHDRAQLQSKLVDILYDSTALAPTWDKFLTRVQPDREMREFLQRWFGLSMLGVKSSNMAVFYGNGANGKSVMVDIIARILSGYAASLRIESITGTNRRGGAEATPDLIPLLGARMVRTSEPGQNTPLQEGLIKMMTGGEPIPVRANYGDQIDLDPLFKLTMSTNHKPDVRGGDDGIWRRLLLVLFGVQIPKAEQDERLGEKLWLERAGILNWLVEGALDYLEVGLAPPAEITSATDEYREESDPLGSFLLHACVITGDHGDSILTADLMQMFNYYLMERAMNTWKPGTITNQLAARSRQWKHPKTGLQFTKSKASLSQYIGIRLTDDFDRRYKAAQRDQKNVIIGIGRDDIGSPAPQDDF